MQAEMREAPAKKGINHKGHKGHKVGARFIAPSDRRQGLISRKERKGRKKDLGFVEAG